MVHASNAKPKESGGKAKFVCIVGRRVDRAAVSAPFRKKNTLTALRALWKGRFSPDLEFDPMTISFASKDQRPRKETCREPGVDPEGALSPRDLKKAKGLNRPCWKTCSDTGGKVAKARGEGAKLRFSRDHLMHTRCPAITAVLVEKSRGKAEENDLSSRDR